MKIRKCRIYKEEGQVYADNQTDTGEHGKGDPRKK